MVSAIRAIDACSDDRDGRMQRAAETSAADWRHVESPILVLKRRAKERIRREAFEPTFPLNADLQLANRQVRFGIVPRHSLCAN